MRPKRLISLLVAVCMMITMLPLSAVTAFAADTEWHDANDGIYKYWYTLNSDNTATIRSFAGPVNPTETPAPYDIEIPATLDGYTVTGLGDLSFSERTSLGSVTLGENIQTIGEEAFYACPILKTLTINGTVTSMGKDAFADCPSLTSVTLGQNIKTIGEKAFYNCPVLDNVIIPQNVTSIGPRAFNKCTGLKTLTINSPVMSMGEYAFADCNQLTSLSLCNDLQTIGNHAFEKCTSLKTVNLPKNLTSIGSHAFDSCTSLDPIEIPGTVTEIGDYAFYNCDGLKSATIDEGVQSTGVHMFYDCDNLATVNLPESLTTIGAHSFGDCYVLNHVKIPDKVTSIGEGAFVFCRTLSDLTLTLGNSLTEIGKEAFSECSALTTLTLPSSLKKIDEGAFCECNGFHTFTLPRGVEIIGKRAFASCENLTSITLPDSVTEIGQEAFERCEALESITIPEKVTTIEPDTFFYCFGLKYITLPAGLTSFKESLQTCTAGQIDEDWKKDENGQPILDKDGNPIYIYTPNGAIYYNSNKTDADKLLANSTNTYLKYRNFLYLCNVTFDAKGGELNDDAEVPVYKTEKITDTKANDLTAIHDPTRAGYKFTGWYTEDGKDGKLFDVDETAITEDITLYARWEFDPNAPVCRPLTVTGGTVTVKYDGSDVTSKLNSKTDAATGKKTYDVPEGATVTVTLDKTLIPEGMVFDIWSTGKFSLPLGQDYKAESITFTMNTMSSDADIAAQYRDATIEDDGPNVLGTAAIIGTAAVGGAVLGYQAYSLGTEFAGKLMALPYFPSNRSALAMMLWEDAGKPMPESELLYPDVGQEEQDMDLQHAARWAMENELIPDLNDEGTAPEEMKFFPANPVSKIDVLNAWQKAQELKNN